MRRLSLLLLLSILPGGLPAHQPQTDLLENTNSRAESSAGALSRNQPIAEVRFETAFGGIVFFPVSVNSAGPLQFLLDTGGAGSSVDREVASRLGLKMERGQASVSGNAALEVGVIPSATLTVGQGRFEGQLMAAPLSPLEPIFGRPLEGILGGNFMRQMSLSWILRRK